jgi:hypothetical protein
MSEMMMAVDVDAAASEVAHAIENLKALPKPSQTAGR